MELQNEKINEIDEKINQIDEKMNKIDEKMNKMISLIENLKKSTDKMDNHIYFIEETYNNLTKRKLFSFLRGPFLLSDKP